MLVVLLEGGHVTTKSSKPRANECKWDPSCGDLFSLWIGSDLKRSIMFWWQRLDGRTEHGDRRVTVCFCSCCGRRRRRRCCCCWMKMRMVNKGWRVCTRKHQHTGEERTSCLLRHFHRPRWLYQNVSLLLWLLFPFLFVHSLHVFEQDATFCLNYSAGLFIARCTNVGMNKRESYERLQTRNQGHLEAMRVHLHWAPRSTPFSPPIQMYFIFT